MITQEGESIISKEDLQKQAIIRLMILVLFPFGVYAYEEYALIPDLKARNARLTQEVSELSVYNEKRGAAVAEIKKYEDERNKIQKKIKFLNNLSMQRSRELRLHQFFQNTIPPKMWFMNYEYNQPDNKITIVARTLDRSEINLFRTQLLGNVIFKSAEISRQVNTNDKGVAAVEFELLILLENENEPAT